MQGDFTLYELSTGWIDFTELSTVILKVAELSQAPVDLYMQGDFTLPYLNCLLGEYPVVFLNCILVALNVAKLSQALADL